MGSNSIHGSNTPCECKACRLQYQAEAEQVAQRRISLGLESDSAGGANWGLAFSGGGIRSATFCLGVLQAMSRAKAPNFKANSSAQEQESSDKEGAGELRAKLLPYFDYLSTVSGGGYIGSFFCSLFKGGRLRPYLPKPGIDKDSEIPVVPSDGTVKEAAINAYRVFQFDPPGRIIANKRYDEASKVDVGDGPLAWIRENGRYLTPGGAGDLLYGIALALRNWISVQFVIGMPVLWLLMFISFLQLVAADFVALFRPDWASSVQAGLFWVPGLLMLVGVAPCILAFWMFYAKPSLDADQPVFLNISIFLNSLFAVVLVISLYLHFGGWWLGKGIVFSENMVDFFCILTVVEVVAIFISLLSAYLPGPGGGTVKGFRVRVTRWLSNLFFLFVLSVAVAFADWVGRFVYYNWSGSIYQLTPAGLLVSLVWGVRVFASLLDGRFFRIKAMKLPLDVLAMILGIVLAMLIVVAWWVFARWLVGETCRAPWPCQVPGYLEFLPPLVFIFPIALVSGRFLGFINLSSLQALYSARLTRAYLGGSNGYRFKWERSEDARRDKLSVSEALPGDDLTLEEYYGSKSLSPLHLINVTVNLTVDPAERLVQRDRKGLPLCIAPSIHPSDGEIPAAEPQPSYRFILDGRPRKRSLRSGLYSEADQPLTVGHWIATSGAAFTTGLGRQTSLGISLLLGLANIRLGTWWPANFTDDGRGRKRVKSKDGFWARIFPTQTYLFYEFLARFHGVHRDYLYLSDGGHFENTGVYELLRSGRNVKFIVMCDCGADPTYEMGDLANLIRLVRLDQALEIEADDEFRSKGGKAKFGELDKVLGVFKQFAAKDSGDSSEGQSLISTFVDDQCALLFNVYQRGECGGERKLKCVLLVIKPNLIMHLPDDVRNYASSHPDFPNESTVDQFFDEAQFESYRQLGLNMGELLFGRQDGDASDRSTYEKILWRYLNMKFHRMGR